MNNFEKISKYIHAYTYINSIHRHCQTVDKVYWSKPNNTHLVYWLFEFIYKLWFTIWISIPFMANAYDDWDYSKNDHMNRIWIDMKMRIWEYVFWLKCNRF